MAEALAVRPQAPPLRLGLHLSLLALTIVSTTIAGAMMAYRPGLGDTELLSAGASFAAALLAILLSHEMGHYVFARIHRVDTTLPYVIPAPPFLPGLGMVSFGTLGAVIRMRSPIPTRDALVDIGAAGPIVGALVAIPLLFLGLGWSTVIASATADHSFWFGHETGLSLLLTLVRAAAHQLGITLPPVLAHAVAPPPTSHVLSLGDNLLMRLAQWIVFGVLPPGQDVVVHPVAMAAWFGLLVTSLNLFPLGQLDGGHVSYAVLGPKGHRLLGRAVSYGLLLMAFFSSLSWLLWWFVSSRFIGLGHPPVQNDRRPLGPLRLTICVLSLLLFIATLIPVPMDQI
jgi:membrane-associated protease RseP (regulator of RpoE activity)